MIDRYTKLLSDCPADKTFKTDFGEIKNLTELKRHLLEKGKSFFDQHVYENENHFASWVQDVYQDIELSSMLRNEKSFGATVKLLDDATRYAELWLDFNGSKEYLNNYLMNAVPGEPQFEPAYHKFETDADLSNLPMNKPEHSPMTSISEIADEIKSFFIKKEITLTPNELLKDSQPVQNTTVIKHKKDDQLLLELEKQYPGIKLEEPQKKKGIFGWFKR